MHYQAPPHEENKLVSCSRGAIYDVIVDPAPGLVDATDNGRRSRSRRTTSRHCSSPRGARHGFITLDDDTVVRYDISEFHAPDAARGVRFDDPAFGIEWPLAPTVISPRDLAFPPFAATA